MQSYFNTFVRSLKTSKLSGLSQATCATITLTDTSSGGRSNTARGKEEASSNSAFWPHAYIFLPRLDHEERVRKRIAREGHSQSQDAQKLTGLRAKLHQKKRHAEKIQMKKAIKAQEERDVKGSASQEPSSTPLPNYLLDRSNATNAKALSSAIKNKRAEKAAKFSVPLPKVKGISEEQMFKVVKTGKKTAKKSWKRMITQPTFVGQDFTRRPVKYERFIRPMGLRYKKANVSVHILQVKPGELILSGHTS
jgi:ribosomal protein S8E